MIPLLCTQCGGKLEADDGDMFVSNDVVVILSGGGFSCPYCGTKFLPGDKVERAATTTTIIGSGNVIGNRNTVVFAQGGQKVGRQVNICVKKG